MVAESVVLIPRGEADALPADALTRLTAESGLFFERTDKKGNHRTVDLAPFLWGPAFEQIAADDELFAAVRVDPEIGTIVWPNGADLDPDVLHGDPEPASRPRSSA